MATSVIDSTIFCDQFSTPEVRAIFSDQQTVQRWLDVEAALARVQARLKIIPQAAAEEISARANVANIDLPELKREMDRTSHPIVPLLRAMKKVCGGDAAEFIHWGATTQDIVDTGTILQVKDAAALLRGRYEVLLGHLVTLAQKHRDLTMVARTHGQQALPMTFGFKVAVWAEEMRRNLERFDAMLPRVLVGQFAGAVGTLAALGEQGLAVQKALFDELGLATPTIHWHVSRDGIAEFACVLAICTGTIGKIAHEIYSLQKTETAELEEPFAAGKVGSSTMPHKRNPPACEGIVALARLVRSNVPLALEGICADHERDKVVLQTEREYITRLCCLADAAAAKIAGVVAKLTVRGENMARNLRLQRGLLMSEPVMFGLSEALGKQQAHEVVYEVAMDVFERHGDFRRALLEHPRVAGRLDPAALEAMLDPQRYTGLSGTFVDAVVQQAKRPGSR